MSQRDLLKEIWILLNELQIAFLCIEKLKGFNASPLCDENFFRDLSAQTFKAMKSVLSFMDDFEWENN